MNPRVSNAIDGILSVSFAQSDAVSTTLLASGFLIGIIGLFAGVIMTLFWLSTELPPRKRSLVALGAAVVAVASVGIIALSEMGRSSNLASRTEQQIAFASSEDCAVALEAVRSGEIAEVTNLLERRLNYACGSAPTAVAFAGR